MKKRGAGLCLKLAAALAALLIFSGFTEYTAPQSCRELFPAEEPSLLLFRQDGDRSVLVTGGEETRVAVLGEGGSITLSLRPEGKAAAAEFYGDSVYLFLPESAGFLLEEYSLGQGEKIASRSVPVRPDSVIFLTCDGAGTCYCVTSEDPARLLAYGPEGETASWRAAGEISFLQLWDDTVWLYAQGRIFRFPAGEAPSAGSSAATSNIPARVLSPEVYVDAEGNFCRSDGSLIRSGGFRPDLASSLYPEKQLHALDDAGNLYFASDSSVVCAADSAGEIASVYHTRGVLMGLTGQGVLVFQDDALAFAPFASFPVLESPGPAPSDPEELPVSPSELDLSFSGEHLLVGAGKTVASLRNALRSDLYWEGAPAKNGLCRTGMTVEYGGVTYTVCVLGDVNGSGTVNSVDLRLIQKHLIGAAPLTGAEAVAADLSRNGLVGCEDLVDIVRYTGG